MKEIFGAKFKFLQSPIFRTFLFFAVNHVLLSNINEIDNDPAKHVMKNMKKKAFNS